MKTLTLSLKKQWFDLIKAGVKKEEYREIKPRYLEMFCKQLSIHGPSKYNNFDVTTPNAVWNSRILKSASERESPNGARSLESCIL